MDDELLIGEREGERNTIAKYHRTVCYSNNNRTQYAWYARRPFIIQYTCHMLRARILLRIQVVSRSRVTAATCEI